MSGGTFAEALKKFDSDLAFQATQRPFDLIVDQAFVTRGVDGKYMAVVGGKEYPAVSDGGFGVDEQGIFHFSLEDNPLG